MFDTLWRDRLDQLAAEGRTLTLWLRDDDAVDVTPALDRLLTLCERHSVPPTLAVIPEKTGFPLVEYLARFPTVEVAVHGWSHHSYSKPPAKKQELGNDRPLPVILNEIQAGLGKLQALHGQRFIPMMVPPWNRISSEIAEQLPKLGYRSLSVFGRETSSPLPLLNTHVDIMNWRGVRGGKDAETLYEELLGYVDQPVPALGLLTHHLVHDEAAWNFLENFLRMTAQHKACQWRRASELMAS
jgi:peptidoglycan/xylan/chitin deacetylase (PgdA/CDA1 family)